MGNSSPQQCICAQMRETDESARARRSRGNKRDSGWSGWGDNEDEVGRSASGRARGSPRWRVGAASREQRREMDSRDWEAHRAGRALAGTAGSRLREPAGNRGASGKREKTGRGRTRRGAVRAIRARWARRGRLARRAVTQKKEIISAHRTEKYGRGQSAKNTGEGRVPRREGQAITSADATDRSIDRSVGQRQTERVDSRYRNKGRRKQETNCGTCSARR